MLVPGNTIHRLRIRIKNCYLKVTCYVLNHARDLMTIRKFINVLFLLKYYSPYKKRMNLLCEKILNEMNFSDGFILDIRLLARLH